MSDQYTLDAPFEYGIDPIKGSRFQAFVVPVVDEADALAAVDAVRTSHPASHHCWAYRVGDRTRSNDDGEPGGSAGRPILAQIEGHGVRDVVVVVARWFGGTRLGVGGLIRAYGGCAGKALDRAPLTPYVPRTTVRFRYAYADTQVVDAVLARFSVTAERRFDTDVEIEVTVDAREADALRAALIERSSNRIQPGGDDDG